MLEKRAAKIRQNLSGNHGFGISIDVILPLLLELLDCLKERRNAHRAARSSSALERASLRLRCRRAITDDGRKPRRGEVRAMASEISLEAAELSEQDFGAAYSQAAEIDGGTVYAIGQEGNESEARSDA